MYPRASYCGHCVEDRSNTIAPRVRTDASPLFLAPPTTTLLSDLLVPDQFIPLYQDMSALLERLLNAFESQRGDPNDRYEWFRTAILQNPLNAALAVIVIYLFISLLLPYRIDKLTPSMDKARSTSAYHNSSYSYLPEHPPVMLWKKYTPRTLAVHDGSDFEIQGSRTKRSKEDSKILLAISGKVFDVTKGSHFYGPGRDASRGMAKQSFDLDTLTPLDRPIDTLEDLSPMEITNMREWESHFSSKYGVVGELVNEGEEL